LIDAGGTLSGTPTFMVEGLQPGWQYTTVINPLDGTFDLISLSNGIAAVPETSTVVMSLLAVAACLFYRLRRVDGT
jgi:hypothetical protein